MKTLIDLEKLPVKRLRLTQESMVLYACAPDAEFPLMNSQETLEAALKACFVGAAVEEFWCIALDSAHRAKAAFRLATGTTNQAAVYPAEVMRHVLYAGCSVFVVAHNHPSGEARPSMMDKELTQALNKAAHALMFRMLDHIILTPHGETYSFRKDGLL